MIALVDLITTLGLSQKLLKINNSSACFAGNLKIMAECNGLALMNINGILALRF
jgi:hypothetical protein